MLMEFPASYIHHRRDMPTIDRNLTSLAIFSHRQAIPPMCNSRPNSTLVVAAPQGCMSQIAGCYENGMGWSALIWPRVPSATASCCHIMVFIVWLRGIHSILGLPRLHFVHGLAKKNAGRFDNPNGSTIHCRRFSLYDMDYLPDDGILPSRSSRA